MPDDFNVQRRRQSAVDQAIDRIADPSPPQGAHYKGQVYNGGSMPSTVPRMYLTRPVETSCVESEGATPTDSVSATGSVPVLVTGPGVPTAGDQVLARLVGGLWVGRTRKATVAGPPPGCSTAAQAPRSTLTIVTNYLSATPQTVSMPFLTLGPPVQWESACLEVSGGAEIPPYGTPSPGYRRLRLVEVTIGGPRYQYTLHVITYRLSDLAVCQAHATNAFTQSAFWNCTGANAGPLFYNSDSVFDIEVRQFSSPVLSIRITS